MICLPKPPVLLVALFIEPAKVVVDLGLGATRATPVRLGSGHSGGGDGVHDGGTAVHNATQVELMGAANVTNLLLEHLRAHALEEAAAAAGLHGFEIMLTVKATKEEQLRVAPSADAAFAPRQRTTALWALNRTLGGAATAPITCGNELSIAAEVFFSPLRATGQQHGFFGPLSPAPRRGIHELVAEAAAQAGLPCDCDVVAIGGSANGCALIWR